MNTNILFRSSRAIVEFVDKNPINWSNYEFAKRGGIGDQAGIHRYSPVVNLWVNRWNFPNMPTTDEFKDFCIEQWIQESNGKWPENPVHIDGITAKLHRNFYPSCVDLMHVFALLVESKRLAGVEYDYVSDSVGKIDLTVTRDDGNRAGILLKIGTPASRDAARYKSTFRKQPVPLYPLIPIDLDTDIRDKTFGNKRWYELEDFQKLFDWADSCKT
jgi:hypothetical protein